MITDPGATAESESNSAVVRAVDAVKSSFSVKKRVTMHGSGVTMSASWVGVRAMASSWWKVVRRVVAGRRGLAAARARAEAWGERAGGEVRAVVRVVAVGAQSAVSTRWRSQRRGAAVSSSVVGSGMDSVSAGDADESEGESLKPFRRYLSAPPTATTSAAPPPRETILVAGAVEPSESLSSPS